MSTTTGTRICPVCQKALPVEKMWDHLWADEIHQVRVANMLVGKHREAILRDYLPGFLEKMDPNGWAKYPSLNQWTPFRGDHVLSLPGATLFAEPKRDGSLIAVFFYGTGPNDLLVYTHNQMADEKVARRIKELLKPYLEKMYEYMGEHLILYGEFLEKGRSPARFELHEREEFLAFDFLDTREGRFLGIAEKAELYDLTGVPHIMPAAVYCIEPGLDNLQSMALMGKIVDGVTAIAQGKGLEGYVLKWFTPEGILHMVKAKVEYKYCTSCKSALVAGVCPTPDKHEGKQDVVRDTRPSLELSEVLGAINKVRLNMQDEFWVKKKAMPAIARAVQEEEQKHGKKNRHNVYALYMEIAG